MINTLVATSYEISNGRCYVDGVLQSTTQACTEAVKTGGLVAGIILIPLLLVGLVLFVFWVLALIHAIKHQDVKDRTIWLIVLIAGFFLGFAGIAAIVYYFAGMRPYKKNMQPPSVAPAAPANAAPQQQVVAPTQPEQTNNQ